MDKKQKVLIVIFSLLLVLLISGGGVYFLFFPQKENIAQQDRIINETQKHTACLNENEYADYPLDKKSNPILKIPKEIPVLISVRDKVLLEEKINFLIDNIRESYHPIELHKCGVYVVKLFNYNPKKTKQDLGYREELWRYGYDGSGKFLILLAEKPKEFISYYSPDFRISPNEKYLVLEKGYLGKDDYSLVIKDLKTKQDVFVLSAKEIIKQYPNLTGGFDMRGWTKDGRYFWGDIFDGADTLALFRIDADAWKWEIFEAPPYTMGGTALNPEYGYITYDDGPPWTGDVDFDEINKEKWLKEGKKLNFYFYNLFIKKQILLETVDDPLWNFKPKWLSDTELQYELPSGEKKIYKID